MGGIAMPVSKIDPMMANSGVNVDDIKWVSAHDRVFSLHGVFYDEERGMYARVPSRIAEKVSPGVAELSLACSGGRLRFVSDSPYIGVRASVPAFMPMPHMTITGSHGFSVYADGCFVQQIAPPVEAFLQGADFSAPMTSRIHFSRTRKIPDDGNRSEKLFEIYFPMYGGVAELYIGIQEGSVLKAAPEYTYKKPILFYGSSITQGACVSRPGNDYVSMLARWLDSDYINLGFSGCGNAEKEMLDYIVSLDASVYAYDYNLYDSRPERVLPPHYDIYKQIRSARPEAAVLLHDKPFSNGDSTYERRRGIIADTYERACREGDRRVIHIAPEALLGKEHRDSCVADGSHPNDLGAMRMAQAMHGPIKAFLETYYTR